MLNKDNQRELCYLVTIDEIKPIEGKDRVECAVVGGWTIMVRKGQFEPGDVGIYFEIDSKVPETEEAFAFLAPKKYKIKTQKYGKFYSQGLLMSAEDFGWETQIEPLGGVRTEVIIDGNGDFHYPNDESRFLTKTLGVTYAVPEDNKRKANSVDKYKAMAQRHHKLFAKQPFRWLMKRDWGKKLLFIFFGKKKDKRGWPAWVKKTDEERVENMPWILEHKEPWVATEKIDGTSTTFTMKRGRVFHSEEFYICSRNVVFDKPGKQCYYDSNVYLEMAEKYDIENKLREMLTNHPEWDWITIQGETYGAGIQKNTYDLTDHQFMAFNLVTSDQGRWGTEAMVKFLEGGYQIPCVPILDSRYILPDTIEELRACVHSEKSIVNHKIKEGVVFRAQDGSTSFKCVDPDYLVKYHG